MPRWCSGKCAWVEFGVFLGVRSSIPRTYNFEFFRSFDTSTAFCGVSKGLWKVRWSHSVFTNWSNYKNLWAHSKRAQIRFKIVFTAKKSNLLLSFDLYEKNFHIQLMRIAVHHKKNHGCFRFFSHLIISTFIAVPRPRLFFKFTIIFIIFKLRNS